MQRVEKPSDGREPCGQFRLQILKTWRVAGTSEEILKAARRGLGIERSVKAQPQNLGQVVNEAGTGNQNIRVGHVQETGVAQLLESADRVLVEDFRVIGRMHKLQILSNELKVD